MSSNLLEIYEGVCLDCKMPYIVLPRRTKRCFFCRTGRLETARFAPLTLVEGIQIHFERPTGCYSPTTEGEE